MSELGTRKGQRTKKVPKHMQFDDADYGTYLSVRSTEPKDKSSNPAEISQIARLLQRYLANINQKLKDHHRPDPIHPQELPGRNPNESDNKRTHPLPTAEGTLQKPSGVPGGVGKRGRDGGQRVGGEGKAVKTEGRKGGQGSRSHFSASSLQPQMHYHALLNDHIRSAYPNANSISPDMLKTLDIPKELLQGQNGSGKPRQKDEKAKGQQQLLRSIKGGREGKEELKPFKRQSYHVAIAYHIHLKRIKSATPSTAEIDPTYAARKLRENQNQPPPKQ